ncbi:MAG: cobamide remodeling phosphodiesterase CbiR [Thermodesulfobacteriota bacterium]
MTIESNHFHSLKKSYKGRYPFRLGTTSFIHPAGYADNVATIGPYVDEIELLFFETLASGPGPLREEVRQIHQLSNELKVSFNVHLPSDVSPGHKDKHRREAAVHSLKGVIDLTAPLFPSTLTLHLPLEGDPTVASDLDRWQERTTQSVKALLDSGVEPQTLSVETLDYPFEMVEPIVKELDLKVCLDIGHCIVHGFNYVSLFSRLYERIVILHLHGVDGNQDHLSLDRLAPPHAASILNILKQFKGVASLEVFSYGHLKSSLEYLEDNYRPTNLKNY